MDGTARGAASPQPQLDTVAVCGSDYHQRTTAMTTIREADLPGIGRKFEIPIRSGEKLVIVIHDDGRRELYVFPALEADQSTAMGNLVWEGGLALTLMAAAAGAAARLRLSIVPFLIVAGLVVGPHLPPVGIFDLRFERST